jgi:hypothetical protein
VKKIYLPDAYPHEKQVNTVTKPPILITRNPESGWNTGDILEGKASSSKAKISLFSIGSLTTADQNAVKGNYPMPLSLRGGDNNPTNSNGQYATAILLQNGTVICSGSPNYGGTFSENVRSFISSDIIQVHVVTEGAFVALKATGEIISWGNVGEISRSNVAQIATSLSGFALLYFDGKIEGFGPYQYSIPHDKYFVRLFAGGYGGYSALANDGSLSFWGYATDEGQGNNDYARSKLGAGAEILSVAYNYGAGAALLSSCEIVSWGHPGYAITSGSDFSWLLAADIRVNDDGLWHHKLNLSKIPEGLITFPLNYIQVVEQIDDSDVFVQVISTPVIDH